MRVISGLAKGHKLKSPKGIQTRPTTDRIKESLFNIISAHIYDSNILDLFAGTGGLGIEALSRGAKFSVFVDKSLEAIKVVKENLIHTKLHDMADVLNIDWLSYINTRYNGIIKYNIIFIDPPYSKGLVEEALKAISDRDMLSNDGIIVVETDKQDIIPESIGRFGKADIREYGRTIITIYSIK